MMLMPLDHTREFFTNFGGNPLDPQQTTFMLFLTRWMTHLCAPVFVFLAGTSIFLQHRRKSNRQLTRHLLTRGLWLIIAELTLVNLIFNFNWQWNVQLLEVIWAIGASMMIMAAFIHLRDRWNVMIGALLVLGHNALDGVMPERFGPLDWLWHLLHVPGSITGPPMRPPIVIVAYPLLPWLGVMALGYAFGRLALSSKDQRLKFERRAGVTMLASFILLRWSNLYGDPAPWTPQNNWWRTVSLSSTFKNIHPRCSSCLPRWALPRLSCSPSIPASNARPSGAHVACWKCMAVFRSSFSCCTLHLSIC